MPPTVYTDRAIKATSDLIDFYKIKIAELELFKEDLEAGKIEVSHRDFSKYSLYQRPDNDPSVKFWRKQIDRHFDHSRLQDFSIRCDDKYSEPLGICDASVLDFADIIESIMGEDDDSTVLYGETESDSDGYLVKIKFRSESNSEE